MDRPPLLTSGALREAQERTLASRRRPYGLAARMLFGLMDVVYGYERTLAKFRVLEVVARVPYQAWEHVAYVVVTHRYTQPDFARRVFERVEESRAQQDNEQWHLLIIEELLERKGEEAAWLRHMVLPQVLAFAYYHLSWLLYAVRPAWSYRLNADFEDHAEHEYAAFVDERAELADDGYDGLFANEYGRFDTLADLFRQIGHDERVHKLESEARLPVARFS